VNNLSPAPSCGHSSVVIIPFSLCLGACGRASFVHIIKPNSCIAFLCRVFKVSSPSHLSLFGHPNDIWWWVQIVKLIIMQLFPASFYFCHKTQSVRDHVSHPHKRSRIVVLSTVVSYHAPPLPPSPSNMATFSCRNPASAGIYHDSCCSEGQKGAPSFSKADRKTQRI